MGLSSSGSQTPEQPSATNITRQQFLEFFRSDDYYDQLSTDDCIEVFRTALKGSSDITAELLNDIISDYSVDNLEVRTVV